MSPRKGDARSPDSEKNPPSSSVDRGNPLPRVGASQFGLCSNASDYRLRTPVQRFHLARPPCSQKGINAIGAVRDEFLKNKPGSFSHQEPPNLIDEAPFFSKDVDFNSTDHTLQCHLETPPKFIFKNYLTGLVVSVALQKGVTLEDGEYLYNAISKLYSRVIYYQHNS